MPPATRTSTPRPLTLVVIAVLMGSAGFGLAHASLDVDRAALANEGNPGTAVQEPTISEVDDGADAPSPPVEPQARALDAATIALVAPVDAGTATAAAAIPPEELSASTESASSHVETGRVAYIRCEGAPDGACPRDVGVERRAWDAIRALDRCEGLRGRVGEADVRIVFDAGRYSGIGFREFERDGLDVAALRACLESPLRELRSSSAASRMTVAFRFSLAH